MRISDWSSDVCSSDLLQPRRSASRQHAPARLRQLERRLRVLVGEDFFGRGPARRICGEDRKSVVSGKSVSVRVDLGGRRIIKKKTRQKTAATPAARD